MRPLSRYGKIARKAKLVLCVSAPLALLAALPGCGGGGAGSGTPPPPPPAVTITLTPPTANVLLGKTLQLSATVSGAANTAVTWTVNGISGASNSLGAISAAGLYTAPADLPSPALVQITATSVSAPAVSASAQVTITSDIAIAVSQPIASVELGARQAFSATVSSAGLPDTSIRWSLTGGACPTACGTVDAGGNYIAPQILPVAASVTLTAQSVADPAKQANILVLIVSHFALQLSAPGALSTSATSALVATLTPVPGSNPSTVLSWSVSGAGCTAAACGILSAVTTQELGASTVGGSDAESANYTAPANAPAPNTVTVTVTPLADPTKKAQAVIAVQAGLEVTLSPISATLAIHHRETFSVQANGGANTSVNWSVNGIPGGNATFGQICAVGSNPCAPVTTSTVSQVDFLAPGALPLPNPVTVQATSSADSSKSATAQVTILNHVIVSVLPGSAILVAGAAQPFTATVLGTTNQSVVWQIQGSGCAIAGSCGTINSAGTFTAPGAPPSPNAFQVVAVSSDDTTQSGAANITVTSGANLQALQPASVYAGGASGFVLRVDGGGFLATSPGPGSALLIGGTSRTTNCLTATECTAAVSAVDVATPGDVTIQIQNPDGTLSNILSLVVVAPNSSGDTIALTGAAPAATGIDITVVQPTTAGVSVPGDDVDLNIAALGIFSVGANTCSLGGNPVVLTRPASGAASFDVCAFSQSGLDTSMSYTITGPGSGPSDVAVIAQQPAGLGIIHLTLQIQSTAQPGSRTLFIQNLNLDKTAASGVFEVQ